MVGILWLFMPIIVIDRFEGALAESLTTATAIGGGFFVLSVLFNFLPDYLSLLETRWMLNWAERSGRLMRLLAVDFVATFTIAIGFLMLVLAFFVTPEPFAPELLPDRVAHMIGLDPLAR